MASPFSVDSLASPFPTDSFASRKSAVTSTLSVVTFPFVFSSLSMSSTVSFFSSLVSLVSSSLSIFISSCFMVVSN